MVWWNTLRKLKMGSLLKESLVHIFGFAFVAAALVVLNILKPVVFSVIIDEGLMVADWSAIQLYCLYFLMLSVSIAIFSAFHSALASQISNGVVTRIKKSLTAHIFNLRYDFFNKRRTGDIVTRIDEDAERIQGYLMSILYVAMEGFLGFLSAMIFVGYVQWRMVVAGFVIVPFLWTVLHLFRKKIQISNERAQKASAKTNEQLVEGLTHILDFRQISMDSRKLQDIAECFEHEKKTSISRDIWSGLNDSGARFVLALGYIVTIGYGGLLVVEQQLSVGHLFAFITLRGRFLAPMDFVQVVYKGFFATKVSIHRIAEVFDFSAEEGLLKGTDETKAFSKGIGILRIKNLSFKYSARKEVFHEINLSFNVGWHGITGVNGAGKTTLTWLILKLLSPYDGGIWINNNINISTLNNRMWRESISVLPQRTYLFSGSLRENVRLYDTTISDADIIGVLRELNLDADLLEVPGALDRHVVEGGTEFSGGQIQKIAIARTVLRNARVNILDEPFSHVDGGSKDMILKYLKKKFTDSIVIIISHDDMMNYVDFLYEIRYHKITRLAKKIAIR